MNERIKHRIVEMGITQADLAGRVGVSRQVVNGWIHGRGSPRGKETLARLADALQCSVNYLLYGEKTEADEGIAEDGSEYISIPCFDAKASCGSGVENFDAQGVKLIKVALSWLRVHVRSGSLRNLNIITASGDSMEPTFHDGDLVLIDTSETSIHSDRIYCLVIENELFLKRVQRIPSGVRLISDNPRYPAVDVTGEMTSNITICGAARCALEARAL